VSYPIAASFDPLETDHDVTSVAFSITVPDDGEVVGVSLVRASDGAVLEERFATGWTLDAAEISTPDAFERGQTVDLGIEVEATAKTQLYNQLLYSPDGVLWYPYGKPFTGDTVPATFTKLPGSEAGQFMLLVSDGVETKSVTSSTFRVPSLPPQVSILRANRWTTADAEGVLAEASAAGVGDVAVDEEPGEPRNLATPVTATAGSLVSLNAKAVDERGRDLAPTELTWEVRDAQGLLIASGNTPLGERFAYRFEVPGTYTVSVRGVDTPTELATSDTIEVVVSPPGLPDASAVDAFRKGSTA
jgi:hypothetical protein